MDTTSDKLGAQFTFAGVEDPRAKICVVGVGGGGGNAVNNMIDEGIDNVEFVAINTDAQALASSRAGTIIQAGQRLTNGMGAGARPDIGSEAILESRDQIAEALHGYDMVFIAAGMGGGTGTGGAPVVASIAVDLGLLTVAVVTTPFSFEGPKRLVTARKGTELLKEKVDTLIVISNSRLLDVVQDKTSLVDAFAEADGVILRATRGIADLVLARGLINLDFADIRTTIRSGGCGVIGSAMAKGEDRATRAAKLSLKDPLLGGLSIAGARNVLVNITGGEDLGLKESTRAATIIHDEAGEETEFIFGAVIDDRMEGELRVTVVATGLNDENAYASDPAPDRVSVARQKMAKSRFNPFEATTRAAAQRAPTPANPARRSPDTIEASMQSELETAPEDEPAVLHLAEEQENAAGEELTSEHTEEMTRKPEELESSLEVEPSTPSDHTSPQSELATDDETTTFEQPIEPLKPTQAAETTDPAESDGTEAQTQGETKGAGIAAPAGNTSRAADDSDVDPSRPAESPIRDRSIAKKGRWIIAVAVAAVSIGVLGTWIVGSEPIEDPTGQMSEVDPERTVEDAAPNETGAMAEETGDTSRGAGELNDAEVTASENGEVRDSRVAESTDDRSGNDADDGSGPTISGLSIYAENDRILLFVNNLTDETAPIERVDYRLLDNDGAVLSAWDEFPLVPAGRRSYGVQMHKAELEPQILSRLDAVEVRATNKLGGSRIQRKSVNSEPGA